MSKSLFQCSVCKQVYPAGQFTAFQKWANGKLEQIYKCHKCVETLNQSGEGK